ncbi:MAG: type II toxin-antitoxin system HicB family antitoxin [Candidatus Sungiibacteriota bacterium]
MRKVSPKKTAVVKTRYGLFTAVLEPEPDMGGFVVTAPKMQGAVSWGKNLTEAKRMIVEAIEGLVEVGIIADAAERGAIRFTAQAKRTPIFA